MAEIIVVGSGACKAIASQASVSFLDTGKRTTKSFGVNRAVRAAQHGWLIVLDADAIPAQGWGPAMQAAFQSGKQVFSGSVDISQGNLWMRAYSFSYSHNFLPELSPGLRQSLPGVGLGFTRHAYKAAGDWDETLHRGQDTEWTLRLFERGFQLEFVPAARVVHWPNTQNTFRSLWASWVDNGRNYFDIREKYGHVLGIAKILHYPTLLFGLSPLLALILTGRIFFASWRKFARYSYLAPLIYLTKIAWCWGLYGGRSKA